MSRFPADVQQGFAARRLSESVSDVRRMVATIADGVPGGSSLSTVWMSPTSLAMLSPCPSPPRWRSRLPRPDGMDADEEWGKSGEARDREFFERM
eukprot:746860-Hanusia_phi.AAC.3